MQKNIKERKGCDKEFGATSQSCKILSPSSYGQWVVPNILVSPWCLCLWTNF